MTDRRRPGLLSPSRLQPVPVELRWVFLVGIGLWTVALVVTVASSAAGQVQGRVVAICATGIGLGLLGLVWDHRRRRAERRGP